MKTRLTLIAILLAMAFSAKTQNISVASFRLLEMDMTANLEPNIRIDQNGYTCALIKMVTTETGFTWNVGVMGITDTQQQAGEIWVWVPFGVKHLTIGHPRFGILRDYYFPIPIEKARTYELVLKTNGPGPGPEPDDPGGAYLMMTVEPKNATVYIDEHSKPVENGEVMIMLPYGKHTYRVEAATFMNEAGIFEIGKERVELNIRLASAKATLTVSCTDAEADIYINDQKKGRGSWTGQLADGMYAVEARKASHRSVKQTLTLAKQEQKTLTLNAPQPIFGKLNLTSSPGNCDVYLDGKPIGKSPDVFSNILVGNHNVELRKEGYAPYSTTVEIKEGPAAELHATLNNSAMVRFTCNAANATLYVDGTALGSASGSYALAYGSHSLRATAEGYDDYTGNFTVSPGNTACTISMNAKFGPLTFTVNGVTFRMLPVEGGTFTMGATAEQGCDVWEFEKPTHSVTLSSFYMGETEVTQALWQAVMGSNPSRFSGSNLPVERVSWNDCQTFINKLNQLLAGQLGGRRFALPTEAQWEYAARGGKQSRGYRYSGSNTLGNVAWYEDNSGSTTHAVGTKQPNELGLYDMNGNVYEWCSDWYGDYSSSAQTDPTGPASGSYPVCRGGSWGSDAKFCRVSFRYYDAPDITGSHDGFRLALCL